MKSLPVWTAVFMCVTVCWQKAYAGPAECSANLPAGLIIRLLPDEKLIAGVSSGPTILTVNSDVRFFPNRPALLARGSKVLGTILESKEAGRFYGKARIRIALTSILTSDFCEYPIDARMVEAGRYKVGDNMVWGRGHAKRDIVALLFPPTTVYQLVRIPSRGPKLIIADETMLTIKLLQPVSLGEAPARLSGNDQVGALRTRVDQIEHDILSIKTASGPQTSPPQELEIARGSSASCAAGDVRKPELAIVQRTHVLRPVRNLTPYHVSLYMDRVPALLLPPCYGPSMISTPATEVKLEATASVLTTRGQSQLKVKVVPNPRGDGWDIVLDTVKPETTAAN